MSPEHPGLDGHGLHRGATERPNVLHARFELDGTLPNSSSVSDSGAMGDGFCSSVVLRVTCTGCGGDVVVTPR